MILAMIGLHSVTTILGFYWAVGSCNALLGIMRDYCDSISKRV